MIKVLEDLCTLTTIPKLTFDKLAYKVNQVICHSVLESKRNVEDKTELDIGIGVLKILRDTESISYKFIPSPRLEKMLLQTLSTDTSPLTTEVEDIIKEKVINTYKDLF